MLLPITLTIAAAAALINLWLGVRISRQRVEEGILTGDGSDPAMVAKMRAHANFAEYAPLVLILLAVVELARGPSMWLWLAGAVFIVARLLHPFGMDIPRSNPLRIAGIAGTLLVMLGLALWALAIAWQAGPVPAATGGVVVTPNA